jgi:hypothetical protein
VQRRLCPTVPLTRPRRRFQYLLLDSPLACASPCSSSASCPPSSSSGTLGRVLVLRRAAYLWQLAVACGLCRLAGAVKLSGRFRTGPAVVTLAAPPRHRGLHICKIGAPSGTRCKCLMLAGQWQWRLHPVASFPPHHGGRWHFQTCPSLSPHHRGRWHFQTCPSLSPGRIAFLTTPSRNAQRSDTDRTSSLSPSPPCDSAQGAGDEGEGSAPCLLL